MFRPLTRDYWPTSVDRPYLRVLTGFLSAPILLAILFSIIAGIIYALTEQNSQEIWRLTFETFMFSLIGLYAFAFTAGLAGFILLWSFRRKTYLSYIATGIIAVLLSVGFSDLVFNEGNIGIVGLSALGILGAIFMALLKRLVGIKP